MPSCGCAVSAAPASSVTTQTRAFLICQAAFSSRSPVLSHSGSFVEASRYRFRFKSQALWNASKKPRWPWKSTSTKGMSAWGLCGVSDSAPSHSFILLGVAAELDSQLGRFVLEDLLAHAPRRPGRRRARPNCHHRRSTWGLGSRSVVSSPAWRPARHRRQRPCNRSNMPPAGTRGQGPDIHDRRFIQPATISSFDALRWSSFAQSHFILAENGPSDNRGNWGLRRCLPRAVRRPGQERERRDISRPAFPSTSVQNASISFSTLP